MRKPASKKGSRHRSDTTNTQGERAINLMDGGPVPFLCSHCGNFLCERCYNECQEKGDFSNFTPRQLDEWDRIPPFPADPFNREMGARERRLLVGTYLFWIVADLNRFKTGR